MWNLTIRLWSGLAITIIVFSTIYVRTSFALGISTEAPSTKSGLAKLSFTHTHTTHVSTSGHEYCYISFTIINRYGRTIELFENFSTPFGGFHRLFTMKNGRSYTVGRIINKCGNFNIYAQDMKTTALIKIGKEFRPNIIATKILIQGPTFYVEAPIPTKSTSTEAPFTYTSSTSGPTMTIPTQSTATETPFTSTSSTNGHTLNKNMTVTTRTPSETSSNPLSYITREANTTREVTAQNVSSNKNTPKNNMLFYVALGVGSVVALALSIIFYVLVKRKIRKNAELRKRTKYWAKINRACASQYVVNEEVATDNPMYEGSRSRTTSNILYGVPDSDNDIGNGSQNKLNEYILSVPSQQVPGLELVIGNACALYQNVDDIYSEPSRASGNYECIRSFIQTGNELKENSYAEPSVIFNEMVVSENTAYISSQRN